MTDIGNDFPSWGESGTYPANGFFYDGGDQVNEKHLDALWNGVETHIDELIGGITSRVSNEHGSFILDDGLHVETVNGEDVTIDASNAGAYVNGQHTGSITRQSFAPATPDSTRIDSAWVDEDGNVGVTHGVTSVSASRYKLAEIEIDSSGTIQYILNTSRHLTRQFRGDAYAAGDTLGTEGRTPTSFEDGLREGDIFYNNSASRYRGRSDGSFVSFGDSRDEIGITDGNGLRGGGSVSITSNDDITLNVEPDELAGDGLVSSNDNLNLSNSPSVSSIDISNTANADNVDVSNRIDLNASGVGMSANTSNNNFHITPLDGNGTEANDREITYSTTDSEWNIEGSPRAGGSTILTQADADAGNIGGETHSESITGNYGSNTGTASTMTFDDPSVVEHIYLEANAGGTFDGQYPSVTTIAELTFEDGTTQTFSVTATDGSNSRTIDVGSLVSNYANDNLVTSVKLRYDNSANDGSVNSQTHRVYAKTLATNITSW